MDTLAAAKQAYLNKAKKDDDDDAADGDEKTPTMRKPAAAAKNRTAATSSNGKIVNKVGNIVKINKGQGETLTPWRTVPRLCEQASRQTFCCWGPNGGKMFSYKEKSRKRAQDEAVSWIKAECKTLRVPVPRSKFID